MIVNLFERARDFLTRAPRREVVHIDSGVAIPQLPLWAQYQRIGGPLTPGEVTAAMRQADQGIMAPLADLILDARKKDGHLQSILGTREMMLANLPWEIVPPEGANRKERKAADFLREALREAKGSQDEGGQLGGFRALLAHMQGAVSHGYALAETVYEKDGGLWRPTSWNLVNPRRLVFEQKTGRPHWWDQTLAGSAYPGIDLFREFAPGKLILHQPRINGDVPTGEGLGRVLLWAALFRSWSIRDWVALGELSWKPWRSAEYDKSSDPDELKTIGDKLRAWSSSGVAVFGKGISTKVEWPKGTPPNGGPKELREELAADMSKAVLGQTLTTEAGSRGARSLGEVHKDVKADIREYDACGDAEAIERWLFAPLTALNFGPGVRTSRLRFLTEEAVDLLKFGQGLNAIRQAGLKKIPSAWVRDRAGIPEAQEGEEVLEDDEVDIPIDPKTGLPVDPDEEPADDQADDTNDDEGDDAA